MGNLWYHYSNDELLTQKEKNTQNIQNNLSVRFWVLWILIIIMFNIYFLF